MGLRIGLEALRDSMLDGVEVFVIGYTREEMACLCRIAPLVFGQATREYATAPKTNSWSVGQMKASLKGNNWLSGISSGLGGLASKLKGDGKGKAKGAKGKGGGK